MKWHLSKWTRPCVFERPLTQGLQQPGLPRVYRGLRGAQLLAPVIPSWNSSAPQTHLSPCSRSLPPRSYPPQPSCAVSLIVPQQGSPPPSKCRRNPRSHSLPMETTRLWGEDSQGESCECRTRTSGFESASALCGLCDRDIGQ